MEKVDDISASIREIENGLLKSKDRMARTKSTIIPRVKQFDALYLDSQVTPVSALSKTLDYYSYNRGPSQRATYYSI